MQEYNKEKYRVCLDKYLNEDGDAYAHAIELAITDGVDGFGVEPLKYAKTEGEDLDDNWGVEITRLVYFNDLDKANKSFAASCEDYDLNIQV